ncbi:hypothetical protein [Alsobacter sp. R-9]
MPLQNRVTPFGEIIATPELGLFMGNRGAIHTADGRLAQRRWARQSWVTCRLEWKDINRIRKNGRLMAPNSYTELFLLDEATALAAGHRPCNDCRKEDLGRLKAAWVGAPKSVVPIDEALHRERIDREGRKVTYTARLDTLPDGAIVELPSLPGTAWLVHGGRLKQWSAGGYVAARLCDGATDVTVLTPRSTVGALSSGYRPVIHPSAESL